MMRRRADHPPRASIALLMVLFSVAVSSSRCLAQTDISESDWKRGFHGFAMLCRAEGMAVVTDQRYLDRTRQDDLLVVAFGGTPGLPLRLQTILDRGGAVLVAADDGRSSALLTADLGIVLGRGPLEVADSEFWYQDFSDCFRVVAIDSTHPVSEEIKEIVANRAGYLLNRRRANLFLQIGRWRTLATTPRARAPGAGSRGTLAYDFMAAIATTSGGRGLAIADHSGFTNQMLACGDNARLAAQAVAWLADGRRDKVMILIDSDIASPIDPTLVDINIPPLTPQQVRDALAGLPPDVFRAVVNDVTAVIEDEGILNDVVGDFFQELPRFIYNRILILAVSLGLAFFAVVFAVSSRGSAHVQADGDEIPGAKSRRVVNRAERRGVALQMLDRFRVDVTGRATSSWDEFIAAIHVIGSPIEEAHLRRALESYRKRRPSYWSRARLEELKSQLDHWRLLLQSGALEYDRPLNSPELIR